MRRHEEKDAELDRRIVALRKKNQALLRRYQEIEEDRRQAEQGGMAVTTPGFLQPDSLTVTISQVPGVSVTLETGRVEAWSMPGVLQLSHFLLSAFLGAHMPYVLLTFIAEPETEALQGAEVGEVWAESKRNCFRDKAILSAFSGFLDSGMTSPCGILGRSVGSEL